MNLLIVYPLLMVAGALAYAVTSWLTRKIQQRMAAKKSEASNPTNFQGYLQGVLDARDKGYYDEKHMEFIAWVETQINLASLTKRQPGAVNMPKQLAWQPDAASARMIIRLFDLGRARSLGEVPMPYDPAKDPDVVEGVHSSAQGSDCEGCND